MNNGNCNKTKQITVCALNVAILAISAQVYIPLSPPVTMQLAVIFFICAFFNFKISFISVLVYLLSGLIGLPVFSGFSGGASALLGATGGFLISFILIPFIFLLFKNKLWTLIICYALSLIVCYFFGILWLYFYLKSLSGAIKSLIIFLPADALKAIFATVLIKAINKRIA